ncbi:MAG: hypothetical protein ACRCYU_14505 [Nocardioides sp.]
MRRRGESTATEYGNEQRRGHRQVAVDGPLHAQTVRDDGMAPSL